MTTADEKPAPPPRDLDFFDILGNLIVAILGMVLVLVAILLVALYGFAGLSTVGWFGLIGGIALGIVVVAVTIVVVCAGFFAGFFVLMWLCCYIFLIDQDMLAQTEASAKGDEPSSGPLIAMWPPPAYRAVAIIAVTAVLWAIYGLPVLLKARSWPEFRQVFAGAVVLPLGFVGMVAHHWLAALGERLGLHPGPRRGLLGAGTPPSPSDPSRSGLAHGPDPE